MPTNNTLVATKNLTVAINGLTRQVKLRDNFWRRVLLGIATGAGTALGASVIATLILISLGAVLKLIGIDFELPRSD